MVANYAHNTRSNRRPSVSVEDFRNEEREEAGKNWARSKGSKHDRNAQRRDRYASSQPRKGGASAVPLRHEEGDSWDVAQMLWAGIDKDAGNSITHTRVAESVPMLWSEGEAITVKIDKIEYDVTILHAKYVSGHNRYTLSFDDLGVRLTVVEGQLMKLFVPAEKPAVVAAPATSLAIVPFGFYRATLREAAATVANESALQAKLAPMRHSERDFMRSMDRDFVFGTMAGWLDDDHPAFWMGVAGL